MNLNINTDSFEVGILPPNTKLVVKRELESRQSITEIANQTVLSARSIEDGSRDQANTGQISSNQNQNYVFNDTVKLSPELQLSSLFSSEQNIELDYANENDLELSFVVSERSQVLGRSKEQNEGQIDFDQGIKVDSMQDANIDIAFLNAVA